MSTEGREPRTPLAPGTSLGDTYTITRLMGRGGMGEVYEASHARLGGRFAVKVIRRDVVEMDRVAYQRFRREAAAMSSLRHPNIVQIIDFNRAPDGSAFIAMEYLEGCDLKARLAHKGRLALGQVIGLVEQVASALAVAHDRGVVHRDLKPANLFLVPLPVAMPGLPEEYVKVLDFGIAKMTSSETLTNAMGLLGTVHYMAPEQIEGVDEIDGRADQFALACICYELLAGKKPFASDTAEGVIYSIVNTQPRSLQAVVDKAVEGVILRGLSKNRSERYPNVRAFATALREASRATADDSPPPARPSAKEANTEGSLSLSALVAAGTKTVLDKTTSVTFKRRAGAALALLSTFGLGLFVMRRFTASASAGAGKATPDTAALVEAVRARVQQTLDDELKTVASVVHVARRIPELRNAARFQVDAVTFGDLFASEEWWLPYRGLSVVVLNGERQLVARNVGDQTDPRAWKLWVKAPGRDINSGIVIGNDQAYLAAGAGIDDKGAYGLVVGKPLNAIRLRRLTKLSDVARIVVTDGKRVFSWPEDATSDSLGQLLIEATDKGRTDLGLPDGRIAIALRRPVGVSLWAVVEDDPNH